MESAQLSVAVCRGVICNQKKSCNDLFALSIFR
jgi:hypothetical protein